MENVQVHSSHDKYGAEACGCHCGCLGCRFCQQCNDTEPTTTELTSTVDCDEILVEIVVDSVIIVVVSDGVLVEIIVDSEVVVPSVLIVVDDVLPAKI
jgi:hypothetical protein